MPIDSLFSIAAAALIGLQFGSFLNVVVWRLPRMLEREWQVAPADQTADEQPVFNLAKPRWLGAIWCRCSATCGCAAVVGIARHRFRRVTRWSRWWWGWSGA